MDNDVKEKSASQSLKVTHIDQLERLLISDLYTLNTKLRLTDLEIKYMNLDGIKKAGLEYLNELTDEISRWEEAWKVLFTSLDFNINNKVSEEMCIQKSFEIYKKVEGISSLNKIFSSKLAGEKFYVENTNFSTLFMDTTKIVNNLNTVIKSFIDIELTRIGSWPDNPQSTYNNNNNNVTVEQFSDEKNYRKSLSGVGKFWLFIAILLLPVVGAIIAMHYVR